MGGDYINMKHDSFEDQKQPEGFEFQIETVSAIKGGGVAVTGKVTEGVLHRGDSAVCVPGAGSSFLCAIQDIAQPDPEQKRRILRPDDVCAEGPGEGRCVLLMPGRDKSDFRAGDRLVPVGSVPLEEPMVMFPKPCRRFLFQIKELFVVQGVGTAAAGTVMDGSAGIGDIVSFGHVPGETVFSCRIKGIDGKGSKDGKTGSVERATADGLCSYGCTLILDEMESRRFRVGEYLFIL